jgi:hypothetical protein
MNVHLGENINMNIKKGSFAKIIDTSTNVFNIYEFDRSPQTCQVEVCS